MSKETDNDTSSNTIEMNEIPNEKGTSINGVPLRALPKISDVLVIYLVMYVVLFLLYICSDVWNKNKTHN